MIIEILATLIFLITVGVLVYLYFNRKQVLNIAFDYDTSLLKNIYKCPVQPGENCKGLVLKPSGAPGSAVGAAISGGGVIEENDACINEEKKQALVCSEDGVWKTLPDDVDLFTPTSSNVIDYVEIAEENSNIPVKYPITVCGARTESGATCTGVPYKTGNKSIKKGDTCITNFKEDHHTGNPSYLKGLVEMPGLETFPEFVYPVEYKCAITGNWEALSDDRSSQNFMKYKEFVHSSRLAYAAAVLASNKSSKKDAKGIGMCAAKGAVIGTIFGLPGAGTALGAAGGAAYCGLKK